MFESAIGVTILLFSKLELHTCLRTLTYLMKISYIPYQKRVSELNDVGLRFFVKSIGLRRRLCRSIRRSYVEATVDPLTRDP
jgi:hypothetical protein